MMATEISADTVAAIEPRGVPASPLEADVRCPLCDYDLRGSAEPRCPECGYPFDWAELLDPTRRRHPYLFEHHPKRNVWSLFRTAIGGLRPTKFWTTLVPAQPSRPRRLFAYFVLTSGLVGLMPFVISVVMSAWDAAAMARQQRAWMAPLISGPNPPAWVPGALAGYDSPAAMLDDYAPRVRSWRFLSYMSDMGAWRRGIGAGIGGLLCWVAWPILTWATLLLFRWSMKRARVQPIHVARCVVYSGDAGLWVGTVVVAMTVALLLVGTTPGQFGPASSGMVMVTMVTVAFFAYRMVIAYRYYLRFDRPVATVIASQIIVALVVLNVLCMVIMARPGMF